MPCSNRSQNLSRIHVLAVNTRTIAFFGVIETLYTFFSSSNNCWEVLSLQMNFMMKRLVTTRWGTRYKTIRAVKTEFQGMIQALNLLTSASENLQTRGNAYILLSIENFVKSPLFYWKEFREQINFTRKKLQDPGIGLDV